MKTILSSDCLKEKIFNRKKNNNNYYVFIAADSCRAMYNTHFLNNRLGEGKTGEVACQTDISLEPKYIMINGIICMYIVY